MKKQYSKTKPVCKVTFSVPVEATNNAQQVVVVGDFNDWDHTGIPLSKSTKEGVFKKTIDLDLGQDFQFRYLTDKGEWLNDHQADWYCASCFEGTENSVVNIPKPADDLTKIEGIGPKIGEVLSAAGIDSFELLSAAKVNDLKSILADAGPKFQMHNPKSWPKQAKLAAKGQWDKLQKLQDELVGGR